MDKPVIQNIVLDTNVILNDATSIFKFGNSNVIIPIYVLTEINNKKGRQDNVGKNARDFARYYMKIRTKMKKNLDGITLAELDNGGTFRIQSTNTINDEVINLLGSNETDIKIISTFINLALQNTKEHFSLITNDTDMIAITDSVINSFEGLTNVDVNTYSNDRLIDSISHIHTGKHEVYITEEIITRLFSDEEVPYVEFEKSMYPIEGKELSQEVCVGDFFICVSDINIRTRIKTRLLIKDDQRYIKNIGPKSPRSVKGIQPRNEEQELLLELLLDKDTNLICAFGKAGTGKTLEALAASLHQVEDMGAYESLLVARPIVSMGNDLGFLPGDLNEKLLPWMAPIYDNVEYIYKNEKKMKTNTGADKKIEEIVEGMPHLSIQALAYVRGRTIPGQIIIIDEAQNLTSHEAKTIITRAGIGTKVILIGDPDQIDNKYVDAVSNGLTYTTEKMKHERMVGIVQLIKTERSPLAELGAELL